MTLMAPVGLPSADGTPPHVAHVPMAIVAAAPGAMRFSHVAVGTGCEPSPSRDRLDAHRREVAAGAVGDTLIGDGALEDDDVGRAQRAVAASRKGFTNSAPASADSTG